MAPGPSRTRPTTGPGGAGEDEGNAGRDPPAADGERVPEKSSGLLRPDAAVAERCALIEAEKANYPITWMCSMLAVPRSSFYDWRERAQTVTPTVQRRERLRHEIARVFEASRGTYGCRRIAAVLNRQGIPCSVGLVAELMRELDLQACPPRAQPGTPPPRGPARA